MSTTWRYRISRERLGEGSIEYAVREVYTGADGSLSWTKDPIEPRGETWKEICNDLALMSRAIGGEVLDLTLDPPALVSPLGIDRPPSLDPEAVTG